MKPVAREWQLVLPLALFFAVFVFAPLALLGVVSFYNDPTLTTPGVAQYVKFLTDRFNMAVLGQTLATLAWQDLSVDAALSGDKKVLYQALLAAPFVHDMKAAKQTMDDLLVAHADLMPQFKA